VEIIFKCLRKNPDERYQRGMELAADLRKAIERIRSGAPALPPPSRPEPVAPAASAATASAAAERTAVIEPARKPEPPASSADDTLRIEPGGGGQS